ncbi:probable pectinesterase/pectinesterase inhibitor 21 [Juglans microcarpa x Juglans regia]|uniref:probable pectinesterase/pectinesterase inhibitor 21 n=1 Tax=Juglans microcarpa x Juglans regia TaxID=2249226 RepID=UPI001B7D976D|nr:probable pectinesterase/pectinesterase inhibitor 21 [Juglans microcarpa x Juglans regia]
MAHGGYNDASNGGNQNKSKKYSIIGLCSALMVAMVVAVAVGANRGANDDPKPSSTEEVSTSMKSVKAICQPTDYKETCEKSLSSAAGNTTDPKELIQVGFHVAMQELGTAMANSTTLKELANDPRAKQALENCKELLEYAVDDLQESFEKIGNFEVSKLDDYLADLKVWLSGAITYEQTCLDGFENTTGDAGDKMKTILKTSQELTKNGLAMVAEISTILTDLQIPGMKRLLSVETDQDRDEVDEVPSWLSEGQRKLLAATNISADVVVAKDGSGKYKTINEALADIPKKNSKTFVIYIKEGVYQETLILDKDKTFVTMIGDGPTKTKITGNKNFVDGTPTFKTSTVSVVGNNFMAKDIGFENSAGAAKHQAVALNVQSDLSIFYNCQIDGYQDTLYAHTHRQFYRDCTISGTIDFIFGDASAVFQNCKMVIRKPMENQQCIVTAQGRSYEREDTGLVLQGCTITAEPAYLPMKDKNKAFLGRPWRQYSRTIIMQSHIEGIIQPEGWLPWMGNFALDTCFYAEVGNMGPGAGLANRVKWRGIRTLTLNQAQQFTPGTFLGGNSWIQPTGVPYVPGLL